MNTPSPVLPPSPRLRRTSRTPSPPLGERAGVRGPRQTSSVTLRQELVLFALLLVCFNLSLWRGHLSTSFSFHPGSVLSGEWWRLLTYPWAHVSWYHLALDA